MDAITARRELEPHWAGSITIEVHADGAVTFADDGIGLTEGEVRTLLGTIGRSSKRDELDLQRDGFLGQFGIGLLACFLVSDTIDVRTRSSAAADAPTIQWLARGDGTFEISESEPMATPGTTVTLRPRFGEQWLLADTIRDLALHYGSLLPVPITLLGPDSQREPLTPQLAPWELAEEAAADYCYRAFGFVPMAQIPLSLPVAGVRGVAFVMPMAAAPGSGSKHRVYLRRILLGDAVTGLVPDWASFMRIVVDVENLRPTASRESLYDDELLAAARTQIGSQLRQWMVRTDVADPALLRRIVEVHRQGVSAAALSDDEVFGIVRDWLPWTTTTGSATLAEIIREAGPLRFSTTIKGYDALESVAAGHGVRVLNAGFSYSTQLLTRLASLHPEVELMPVSVTDLVDEGSSDHSWSALLASGRRALESHWVELSARPFQPSSTPTLLAAIPSGQRGFVSRSSALRWPAIPSSRASSATSPTTTYPSTLGAEHFQRPDPSAEACR